VRDRIVTAVRRAIEAVLPWYDPEREAERDRQVERTARAARRVARRLDSYGRVAIRR
jgi:hypothetical protein